MNLPELLVEARLAEKGSQCEPELPPTMAVVWGLLL